MLSLYQYKKLLGKEADNLTDEEIEKIGNTLYKLVEIIFEKWTRDKNYG
ncbi:MAG: hypothetical protein KAR07_04050 [Spirochaetes bacterium]|nr:hypothetical protein [Spirochaetota bacterium]